MRIHRRKVKHYAVYGLNGIVSAHSFKKSSRFGRDCNLGKFLGYVVGRTQAEALERWWYRNGRS